MDSEENCSCSACFDAKRNVIYLSDLKGIDVYDIKSNKWIGQEMFPLFTEASYGSSGIPTCLFLDRLSGDYLCVGGVDGPLLYIYLNDTNAGWHSSSVQFEEILHDSPVHDASTYERLFCSE